MKKQIVLTAVLSFLLSACTSALSPQAIEIPSAQETFIEKGAHGILHTQGYLFLATDHFLLIRDPKGQETRLKIDEPAIELEHNAEWVAASFMHSGEVKLLKIGEKQWHQSFAIGSEPAELEFSSNTLYISRNQRPEIAQVDLNTLTVKDLKIGSAEGHRHLKVSPPWLAITNPRDNDISLMNLESKGIQRLSAGNIPGGMAFGQEALIVGNRASHTVDIFSLDNLKRTTLENIGQTPSDVLILKNKAYLTLSGSFELLEIDLKTQEIVRRMNLGKHPSHLYKAPNADHIWVSNDGDSSLSIVDIQSFSPRSISVGPGHHKLAFSEDHAYVSNQDTGTLLEIPLKETRALFR